MKRLAVAFIALSGIATHAQVALSQAADLSRENVNGTEFSETTGNEISPVVLKAQVLLDRLRFSPGVIDGRTGDNFRKAVAAFEKAHGVEPDGNLDESVWSKLTEASDKPVLVEYTIRKEDLSGPFVEKIPEKFEELAALEHLSYHNSKELLAEKFHMDQDLLESLNRDRRFEEAGTKIIVADPASSEAGEPAEGGKIEVDKAASAVRLLNKAGEVLAVYPASIGSKQKPAPTGTHKVVAIAKNPVYTYNPDYNFKGVKAKEPFKIEPGPNNPVGTVWIDLSAESYGIHGTPEPAQVGKAASQGCVRLTNWDVEELATMVKQGMQVDFLE
jgi:lipoprotein-anchoring transpeptidase ErfK/SrfK